jgi:excisionase family DNA binding protein
VDHVDGKEEEKMRMRSPASALEDATVLTEPLRPLLEVPDVQGITRLSRAKVYQLIQDGRLPAVRLPGTDRVLVDPEDLRKFIESGRAGK